MSPTTVPKILIADDHTLVAEALKRFLTADFEVVAVVHDGRSMMQRAEALVPDLIVADIGMPLLNGLDAAERIKRTLARVKLVFVTVNNDPELAAEAFRRGASGYLLKTSAATELVTAIRSALSDRLYLSPALFSSLIRLLMQYEQIETSQRKLTERQLEVLQLLAEGRSMKEVAAVLNLTTRTVAFHKYRIMENLSLKSDADIVQYAMRKHIVAG